MRLPPYVFVLLRLLLLVVITNQLFRLGLLFANGSQWQQAPGSEVFRALLDRGLLFDLYLACWMLALPALLLGLAHALNTRRPWTATLSRWWFTLLFVPMVLFCCADIPFYVYLNMRLTRVVLDSVSSPSQMFKELFSTPIYVIALVTFVLLAWFTARMIKRMFRAVWDRGSTAPAWKRWAVLPLVLILLFFGVRGTWDFDDEPLVIDDAYFSETPFLNQLGVNAVFSFADSYAHVRVDLIDPDLALKNVRRMLDIPLQRYTSPIARAVTFDTKAERRNVVLILVESLSADRLQRFGYEKNLMPFLEQLMDSSLVFDRFYSAGTRTCNGIFSSLYGLPALRSNHPMSHPSVSALDFYGTPQVLKEAGYHTTFFYPGDALFDNMSGFLPHNGFDRLIGLDDFADSIPRNSWGVTDHALYNKVLEVLGSGGNGDAPFFATIMTISSHKGYNVPDDIRGFVATSKAGDENIYEYADRALREFFERAVQQHWFKNTVFVILGDHGQRFDPVYEVPLSYHHIPLIIHAPGMATPRTEHNFGTQVDLSETLLGLLRVPHVNNTLGMDLLRTSQPCAWFCSDDRIAALDERYYWIQSGGVHRLYDHHTGSVTDHSAQRPDILDNMRTRTYSMVQTAQWLVDNHFVGKPDRLDDRE